MERPIIQLVREASINPARPRIKVFDAFFLKYWWDNMQPEDRRALLDEVMNGEGWTVKQVNYCCFIHMLLSRGLQPTLKQLETLGHWWNCIQDRREEKSLEKEATG